MGLGPSLRKLLDKYGEDNVYEIITAFGHRIYLKENRKLETTYPDNKKRMGDYIFNDELEVLEINLVIHGENKRYFFSYESIEVLSFDNAQNPIFDFDEMYNKDKPLEKTITIKKSTFAIDKNDNYTEFKFTGESNFNLLNNMWNYFNVFMEENGVLVDARAIDTFTCVKGEDSSPGVPKYDFNITVKVDKVLNMSKVDKLFVQYYKDGEPINSATIKTSTMEEIIDPLTLPIKLG